VSLCVCPLASISLLYPCCVLFQRTCRSLKLIASRSTLIKSNYR
jgi:hypothetical protein